MDTLYFKSRTNPARLWAVGKHTPDWRINTFYFNGLDSGSQGTARRAAAPEGHVDRAPLPPPAQLDRPGRRIAPFRPLPDE